MRHAARASERARLSPLSGAAEQAGGWEERGRERAVPSKSFLPLDKSISSLEGESAPGTAPFAARSLSAPATILAFGLPAGSRASVPEGTLGETLMGERMEGTSEADQYYLFRVGAPSQSGQYGIKGKRPLSVPPSIFCSTIPSSKSRQSLLGCVLCDRKQTD